MDALTPTAVSRAEAPSIGRSITPLLILSLSMVTGFTLMQSFGIMGESAKAELGLSDMALGTVQGVAAAVPLVLFSIPIGILVDRTNRVRLLILLAITWTLGTVVTAAAPNASVLFVGRMLTGIGTAGALTAVLSLSSDLSLPHQRGRAMLINTLGKQLGLAAGFALAGGLLGWFATAGGPAWFGHIAPWRSAQWTLAILSAVLLLPLFLLREPARHEVEESPNAPFKVVARELWSRRAFLLPLFIGQISVVMADAAAGIWASPVLERSYGLKPDQFGSWLGGIIFVTGILGAVFGGLAADWGKKSGRQGGLLYGSVAAAIIGVPAALFPIMPSVTGFAAMIFMLILAGTVTGLITSVALTVLLPNELRGLSIGAFITIAGLIGFGIAPTLVTLISGPLGGEAKLPEALAMVGVVVGLVSVVGFMFAVRHAPANPLDHEL
jgi:MFS family permease